MGARRRAGSRTIGGTGGGELLVSMIVCLPAWTACGSAGTQASTPDEAARVDAFADMLDPGLDQSPETGFPDAWDSLPSGDFSFREAGPLDVLDGGTTPGDTETLDVESDLADAPDLAEPDPGPPPVPPRPRITVNRIPDAMNGKVPFTQHGGPPHAFHLRVPTRGFTVEVYRDDGIAPGPDLVRLYASAPARVEGQTLAPGEDLAQALSCGLMPDPMAGASDKGLVLRCLVPEGTFSPDPSLTLTAVLGAPDGRQGEPDSIAVEVTDLVPWLDPFVQPDVWLVTLSRDLCQHDLLARPDGTYDILTAYLPGGNGIPDLDEALTLLGFLSTNTKFSEAARALFLKRVREYAHEIFGLDASGHPTPWGVPLFLYFEGDLDAPDPALWSEQAGFSMVALGGDPNPEDIATGIVGRAWIDWNNQGVEDNTIPNFGVFVTNIVRQVLRNPLGALILQEVSPMVGTPLGEYPGDEHFLDPDFDPTTSGDPRLEQRHAIFTTIIEFATLAVAVTLCHEMGHSLGLVPNGPPPEGLFGGMDGLPFTDSDAGAAHIDTPGLNVMQTGKVTSYLEALGGVPRFNELNLAYLRRRLVVGTLDARPARRALESASCAAFPAWFLAPGTPTQPRSVVW